MRNSTGTTGFGLTTTMLLAFLVGCAQTVVVPHEELTGCRECTGLHRIQTSDDQYLVQRFAVNDSTVTILEFARADGRYGITEPPVILTLEEVRSVVRLRSDKDYASIVVFCAILVGITAYAIVSIASAFPATD
jgi:hypothetical protein